MEITGYIAMIENAPADAVARVLITDQRNARARGIPGKVVQAHIEGGPKGVGKIVKLFGGWDRLAFQAQQTPIRFTIDKHFRITAVAPAEVN